MRTPYDVRRSDRAHHPLDPAGGRRARRSTYREETSHARDRRESSFGTESWPGGHAGNDRHARQRDCARGGAYETYFADDIVVTMTGVPGEIVGPAAAKAAIDTMHTEQFDAHPKFGNVVIGEGTGALEAVFFGTHTGEFAGIAATGKEVAVPYSVFYELEDGKITNLRIYALVEGIVQQLQAAPA